MQPRVCTVGPDTSVRAVAALMLDRDIGILPVCVGGRPVGVVTDRDLAIRLIPYAGFGVDLPVGTIMTPHVLCCRADEDVAAVARAMGDARVRRLLVCESTGKLVGIVSLGDIARDASEELAGQALGEIVDWR